MFRWFAGWRDDGLFEAINHSLVVVDRERTSREALPIAFILDKQGFKTAKSGDLWS